MKKKQIQNYTLLQVLGQGSFGKVHKAIHTISNSQFAIKVIPVQKFQQDSRLQTCSANQIKNLTRIESNLHIIKFIQMLKTPNNFYFVYQYCNGKTLEAKLKQETKLSQSQSMKIFQQLLEAFKVLNKYNIMHRDLKPDNIFIHNGDIKLGDFGFCKTLMTQDDMTSTMLGSPIYMAPEVLRGEIYTSKADIWSLGVVLYEMVYGYCPFESNSIAKLIAVLDNQELVFPEEVEVSEGTKRLIRRLLVKDQFKRIDWFELLTMGMGQENCTVSVTQSLSAAESGRLSGEWRKYNTRSIDDSETLIKPSNSTRLLSSCGSSNQQKCLTFRKKSDQNSHNPKSSSQSSKLTKATSLKYVSPPQPVTPFQYSPLQKLEPNIPPSAPTYHRKPSHPPSLSLKRTQLLSLHNACLIALRTAINFMKSKHQNSHIFTLIILRRIQSTLIKIIDSIGFGELELEDILSTSSQELRQVQKQVKELQKELERNNIDSLETFSVKSTLRQYYNQDINKCLWYEMICFLSEERVEVRGEEGDWTVAINNYLTI